MLRSRAVERAQHSADSAQRRFMMVDPGNRLVADTQLAQSSAMSNSGQELAVSTLGKALGTLHGLFAV
jgi:hypothetical protein